MESAEFEELYQRHAPELRTTIRRIVREIDAAEDVLQEVFIRAWNKKADLEGIHNPGGWLTRIAVNLSLNALRSRNRKREILLGNRVSEDDNYAIQKSLADYTAPGPETELIRNTRINTVRKLISALPPEKRDVLKMVDQYDLSIQETSERLGIPDGTVKSRLYYGRRMLSEQIREIFDE
jgi:RNA polymerase sigma-70 factor (ECF subfamily)